MKTALLKRVRVGYWDAVLDLDGNKSLVAVLPVVGFKEQELWVVKDHLDSWSPMLDKSILVSIHGFIPNLQIMIDIHVGQQTEPMSSLTFLIAEPFSEYLKNSTAAVPPATTT